MKSIQFYLFVLLPTFLFAQERIVGGEVIDDSGEALPFVKVSVKGKSQSITTDLQGGYSLKVTENDTLVFSFFMYATKELKAKDDYSTVVLKPDTKNNNSDLLTVGLGQMPKENLTAGSSNVSQNLIIRNPNTAIFDGVQGMATGVKVLTEGTPGVQSNVSIRGIGTLITRGNPLYVVDGIIMEEIGELNIEDIASIKILKDASLLAAYGSRGANGVVLVTTKRGVIGDLKVSVSALYGIKEVSSKIKMVNTKSLEEYTGIPMETGEEVDWFDELTTLGNVFRGNIAVSSGAQNIKTYVSAGFYDEKGILENEKYTRGNFTANLDLALSSKLNFSFNGALGLVKSESKPIGAFENAYQQVASFSLRNEDGLYNGTYGPGGLVYGDNPVGDVALYNYKNETSNVRSGLILNYEVTDYLTFSGGFGFNYRSNFGKSFAGETEDIDPMHNSGLTYFSDSRLESLEYNYNVYGDFHKTIAEKHSITAVVGFLTDFKKSSIDYGTVNQVPEAEHLWNLPNGFEFFKVLNGVDATGSITHSRAALNSVFARINYDFQGRYLLNASSRRDRSNDFLPDTEVITYSIGAAWVVSNEKFLQNQTFINVLKLRGNFGEVANQRTPTYATLSNRIIDNYIGAEAPVYLDSDLGFEISDVYDVGVDFGLFKNHLIGEFNYYNRANRSAALVRSDADTYSTDRPIDVSISNPEYVFENAAKIRNTGYEIGLTWNDRLNADFSYHLGLNFSKNTNNVYDLNYDDSVLIDGGDVNGSYTKRLAVGESVGAWYMYEAIGVNDMGEILYENTTDGSPTTDASESQKKFVGKSEADVFYGVNLEVEFKNFDFSIQGFGSAGAEIYNAKKQRSLLNGGNIEQRFFDNRNNEVSFGADKTTVSTYFLEHGDFFRINNITIGYNFKNNSLWANKVRLFVTAKNPFVFTKYSGYTTELPGRTYGGNNYIGTSGIDTNSYPSTFTIVSGLVIDF